MPSTPDAARTTSRQRGAIALLSLVAAIFAIAVHEVCFARGSLNNDEVAYVLQAKAIRHGHLFPAVTQPIEAHRVWFFVARPVGLVSKYLPLVSLVLALSLWLTGSLAPLLGVQAAILPWLVAGLAAEVGLRGRYVVLAAALVTLSPVVLMESAIPLSYTLFLVLTTATWWLVLRLAHRRSAHDLPTTIAVGVLTVAAAAARPFDTVLLLGPVILWALWQRRPDAVRLLVGLGLGALPLLVLIGLYDHRATGSALHLPFNLLEPSDQVGFGTRRMFPEQSAHHFGPLQGLIGLGVHFVLGLLSWLLLGPLLLAGAIVAWRRTTPTVRALLVATAAYLIGYGCFWGPWNFSILWGDGTRVLGPIYAMALTVPIVLAALPIVRTWVERGGRRAQVALGILGVLALLQLTSAVHEAHVDDGRTRRLLALADDARAEGPLLFDTDPAYLGHPVSWLIDDVSLSAATAVPPAGAPAGQLLQLPYAVYGPHRLDFALTRQQRVQADELVLRVTITQRDADVLVVERAGRTHACTVGEPDEVQDRRRDDELRPAVASVTVTPTGALGCDDTEVPEKWLEQSAQRCLDDSCVAFAVFHVDEDDGDEGRITLRQLPVQTEPTGVAMLVDGGIVASSGRGWLRVTPG